VFGSARHRSVAVFSHAQEFEKLVVTPGRHLCGLEGGATPSRYNRTMKNVALALSLFVALFAFAGNEGPKGKLKKVDSKTVCMVNETAMGKDQIPVQVDGKTYYGCCEMCKEQLVKNADKRAAVDPVTGNKVDKATAVIAAQDDGRVFYFESEETLAKHNKLYDVQ
jgi:YHS domain-containing protein